MELLKKVKIALDETRILILGVQILLGFQLRGVFSDGHEQLPTYVRYLDGLALGLMVCVVGLLITPGPYHRIVESGEDGIVNLSRGGILLPWVARRSGAEKSLARL
jgi:hypothetical protein